MQTLPVHQIAWPLSPSRTVERLMMIANQQPILNGVFLVGASLLVVSGISKMIRPLATVRAMKNLRLPASIGLSRFLGALEAVIGVSSAVTGWVVPCIGSALLYLGFTGFVLLSMAVGERGVSCGCFGDIDTPPSWMHVVLNILFAGAGVAVAAQGSGGLIHEFRNSPMNGLVLVGVVTVGTYVAIVSLVYRAQWRQARFPDSGRQA